MRVLSTQLTDHIEDAAPWTVQQSAAELAEIIYTLALYISYAIHAHIRRGSAPYELDEAEITLLIPAASAASASGGSLL